MSNEGLDFIGEDFSEAIASYHSIRNTTLSRSGNHLTLISGVDFAPANWVILHGPVPADPISTVTKAVAPLGKAGVPGMIISFPPWEAYVHPDLPLVVKQPAMSLDLHSPAALFEPNPAVIETSVICKVSDRRLWLDIFQATFAYPPAAVAFFEESFTACPDWEFILIRYEGVPVGCCSVFFGEKYAGLYSGGTLAMARGKGVGRAAVKAVCERAKLRGYDIGFLLASPQGAKHFPGWGFKKHFDVSIHVKAPGGR